MNGRMIFCFSLMYFREAIRCQPTCTGVGAVERESRPSATRSGLGAG
jgi:hypothetical protein